MNNNLQISTRVRRLFQYLEDFEKGNIQIPPFQRDFLWENNQKIDLLDSIKQGYPIGSILFWRPDRELMDDLYKVKSQKIGSYTLAERGADFFYILDGYQRLSVLFGCLVNPLKTKLKRDEKEWKKSFDIIYNLEEDIFFINRKKSNLEIYEVPVFKFIDGEEFYEFQTALIKKGVNKEKVDIYLKRYKNFGTKISTYDIPSIDLIGGSIKEAVDIFSRLNTKGQTLSDDWKLSALTYNKEKGFILASEIDELLIRLERFNYFNNKPDIRKRKKIILKIITNSFGEVHFDTLTKNDQSTLEKLALRGNFISTSRKTFNAIELAVEFLFKELKVINNKLLPYNSQLIFITDFFNKVANPNPIKLEVLKTWFWVTTYSNYFTRYNLSKQREAYYQFQKFIKGEVDSPIYYDKGKESFETAEFSSKINLGSVRAKALALFMIKHQTKNKEIDLGKIGNYKLQKLFSGKGNISENTILIIDNSTPKIKKDFSYWLTSNENYEKFFITDKMKDRYRKTNDKDLVLRMRKEYIIQIERQFVESLNIQYTLSDSTIEI